MRERLTKQKGGIVFYTKDGQLIAPVNMSSFDIYKVVQRLAEYEDAAEQKANVKHCMTEDCPYQKGDPCETAEGCGGFEGE